MATNTAPVGNASPRRNALQVVHYLRFTVNYNDTGIATGNGKQVLPAGSVILRTYANIATAFNAGTTNVLSVGIEASTYTNMIANGVALAGAAGLKGPGTLTGTALVPLAADSQVFALYTQTGTAATAGQAVIVVEYIPNNDL